MNRAIWALGLRNPFTFTFQPGSGRMFINDVGQNTYEEINDGIAGSNSGTAAAFATGIANPVDLHVASDGSLYYLARGTGFVWRVEYPRYPLSVSRTAGGTLSSAPAGISCGLLTIVSGVAQATILDDDGRRALCNPVAFVPVPITAQGYYCLVRNSSHAAGAGAAITIAADDVLLDLLGFTIDGSEAGAATAAYGIYALNRSQVTVRNGSLVGFRRGVFLDDDSGSGTISSGNVVRSMRTIRSSESGIAAVGRRTSVRGNAVLETGDPAGASVATVYGVLVTGEDARVLGSDVIRVNRPAPARHSESACWLRAGPWSSRTASQTLPPMRGSKPRSRFRAATTCW